MGKRNVRKLLTAMETEFVIHYEAQGFRHQEEAARLAGYKHANPAAVVIVKRPAVKAAIQKRREAALAVANELGVMDRDKLLKLWTTIAMSGTTQDKDKIAASKLLAEYLGMFEKDTQDNVPRSLLQILQCVEGRCPRCGEIVRVQPVEVLVEQPARRRRIDA